MSDIWPPPPTNQSKPPLLQNAEEPNERLGLTAFLLTVLGMALLCLADLSRMHIIAASRHSPKLGHLFDGLGLLGVLILLAGGALGTKNMNTKYGPNAAIMSFFVLLSLAIIIAILAFQGQL